MSTQLKFAIPDFPPNLPYQQQSYEVIGTKRSGGTGKKGHRPESYEPN